MTAGFGIYVHWPFCAAKCPYCDFNSHVRDSVDQDAWRKALCAELKHFAAQTADRQVTSIFFGGGTPSLMPVETVDAVLETIAKHWPVATDIEVTLEANPTSSDAARFAGYRSAGVNRLSLGVQALNDTDLKALGRQHDSAEARGAIAAAQRVFERMSFDLIYARENQTPEDWRAELTEALALGTDHLSLYQLTIEPNTDFANRLRRGELDVPDADSGAALYEITQEVMETAAMPAYEVSNHARIAQESRHNLTYWRYGDYVGVGPGAHGRLTLDGEKYATRTHRAPEIWLSRALADGHAEGERQRVPPAERLTEMLMMGLRLSDGVPLARIEQETGKPLYEQLDPGRLQALFDAGYLRECDRRLMATAQGRLRLNALLAYLLD